MIFMAWPLLVILIVLLDDDLLGAPLVDFSSQPELVPSDWESDESKNTVWKSGVDKTSGTYLLENVVEISAQWEKYRRKVRN